MISFLITMSKMFEKQELPHLKFREDAKQILGDKATSEEIFNESMELAEENMLLYKGALDIISNETWVKDFADFLLGLIFFEQKDIPLMKQVIRYVYQWVYFWKLFEGEDGKPDQSKQIPKKVLRDWCQKNFERGYELRLFEDDAPSE